MEKISGIYRITCVSSGDYYYGSAKNILKRWNDHKRALKNQTHHNPRVQQSWNIYGEENLRLETIELVPEERLFETEDRYLKPHVGKPHCMNIALDAYAPMRGRSVGACPEETKTKIRASLMGHLVSNETRRKISEAQIGKTRKPHPPITEESRQKMKTSHLGMKYPNRKRVEYETRFRRSRYHRPEGFPAIQSPEGVIHNIEILEDLCRTFNLNSKGMSRMISGKRKTYKKWRLA